MDARLRALCDLNVPTAREFNGRHEYDGIVQDLSPAEAPSHPDAGSEQEQPGQVPL